jgi:hypothetical protein
MGDRLLAATCAYGASASTQPHSHRRDWDHVRDGFGFATAGLDLIESFEDPLTNQSGRRNPQLVGDPAKLA